MKGWLREQAQQRLEEVLSARQRTVEERLQEDLPPCDVAILFALRAEAGGLVDKLGQVTTTKCASYVEHMGRLANSTVVVAETGVGAARARRAASDLIATNPPRWLISAGFAGGLSEALHRGHILMADSVVDQKGQVLATGLKLDASVIAAAPGLHVGRLLSVDQPVRTGLERRGLAQQHAAVACDMETMALAQVCRQAKLRFLAVRIVSDAVDDELTPPVKAVRSQESLAAKLGAATGAVIGRPSSVKDFWQTKEDGLRLSDRLATFLVGIVGQLHPA
jgi:adenosylhomocysteine nucleosidase